MGLDLKNRPTLQKTLAGIVALAIAALGMIVFGGDEEKDRKVLDQLCRGGLEELAVRGGLDLCVKDPDPVSAFAPAPKSEPTYYRQTSLCPGDGVSGHRIRVYVGAPADRPAPTTAQIADIRRVLGYAERTLHESNPTRYQKLNFYCATDSTPTIGTLTFPAVGSDGRFTFDDFVAGMTANVSPQPRTIYHAFIVTDGDSYRYGGQGTVMPCDLQTPTTDCLDEPQFSMTAVALGRYYQTVFLHEIGHNIGAVQPSARHSTGNGWHCTDLPEAMCYDDGGSGISTSNPMHRECDKVAWKGVRLEPFDCDGDFYEPDFAKAAQSSYFQTHWNVARSPYLTSPRRK